MNSSQHELLHENTVICPEILIFVTIRLIHELKIAITFTLPAVA